VFPLFWQLPVVGHIKLSDGAEPFKNSVCVAYFMELKDVSRLPCFNHWANHRLD
jgi:hypothetical protein